jgi:hypothetical protein
LERRGNVGLRWDLQDPIEAGCHPLGIIIFFIIVVVVF